MIVLNVAVIQPVVLTCSCTSWYSLVDLYSALELPVCTNLEEWLTRSETQELGMGISKIISESHVPVSAMYLGTYTLREQADESERKKRHTKRGERNVDIMATK
eukprot:COSAG05_NODE_423_length_9941_cov_241.298821_7_plen_104_part_00